MNEMLPARALPAVLLSSVVASVFVGTATAQSVPHTRALPSYAQGAYLGSASAFPFGRTGGLLQYWIRADQVGQAGAVTAIGSRPSRGYSGASRIQSYELKADLSTLAYGAFTGVFASNLSATTRVIHANKNVSIPATTGGTDPDAFAAMIALDTPLILVPGRNLVLEFNLGSAVGAFSTPYNSDLTTLSTSAYKHASSDPSCGGTLTASGSSTLPYTLALTGAAPQRFALFMLSASATFWGGIPLPFKLDPIGLTGCLLSVDPMINIALPTDANGNATLSIPFTAPAEAVALYAQALHEDATQKLVTSNLARSLLGGTGFCRYIYNFSVDGATAENGPFEWSAALLVR